MKPIIKALAAASVCSILLAPALADAQQITFSMSGVVDYGRDDLNLFFGSPGEVVFLGGEAYTMSLSFDAADFSLTGSTPGSASYAGAGVPLTGALTMNGKTLTWTAETAFSTVYLEREPELYSPGDRQAMSLRSTASRQPGTGNRDITASHEVVTFFWPLLASTQLDQPITFPAQMRDAVPLSHFEATGMGAVPNLTTWFDGRATSATWTVSPVPEPGQYGLLAAGLLTLGLLHHRRSRAAPQASALP